MYQLTIVRSAAPPWRSHTRTHVHTHAHTHTHSHTKVFSLYCPPPPKKMPSGSMKFYCFVLEPVAYVHDVNALTCIASQKRTPPPPPTKNIFYTIRWLKPHNLIFILLKHIIQNLHPRALLFSWKSAADWKTFCGSCLAYEAWHGGWKQ